MIKFRPTGDEKIRKDTLFLIPSYQRGYRWQKEDAQKLLQDLATFSGTDYCLQPLELQVATRPSTLPDSACKNYIRVVDGQQRLTTLCIIAKQLNVKLDWDIYYLTEKKHLSDLLQDDSEKNTINASFRYEVEFAVKDFAEKDRIKKYFCSARNIVFPVHFLLDKNTEAEESDQGQNAFKRLNAGKTPLTSSELIRALYMLNDSGLDEQQRMEISKEWELIENTLSNEQFWLMFNAVGLEKTPTRIDLLFALVLDINLKVAKNNPRVVYEKLESGYYEKKLESGYYLLKVWEQVLRCFWWMQSCYEDIECFNYLGWLAMCTETQASTIYADFVKYQKMDVFKKALIKMISDKDLCGVSRRYGDPRLKDLLFLCNVLECNNNQERLRFDRLDTYDIEHIDSQTPNDLSKPEDRKEWLKSVWSEYPQLRNNLSLEKFYVQENIKEIIEEGAKLNTEPLKDGNGLGNLVLLNSHINRSYKNTVFPAKRKFIREALEQGTQYILPCTAKAFMKFYTEDAVGMNSWLQRDYDGYKNAMNALLDSHLSKKTDNLYEGEKQKLDLAPDVASISKIDEQDAVKKTEYKPLEGEVSFDKLMETYEIHIPKIQRLYVQGRPDSFGRKCRNEFASVLVDSVSNGTTCPLDMIYGIADGNVFYPLDGQQRLTTLLLLYWLCRKSQKKGGERWVFDYEARRITELFIRNLLNTPSPDFDGKDCNRKCTEYLEKQAWFMPIWKRDPGIAGMLNMLDSLYEKLQKASEPAEGFHFNNLTFSINYLDASTKEYDHIFLKMNSRGRQLTAWENVKAVLDKYVPEKHPSWQENINLTWPECIWEPVKQDINTLDSNLLTIISESLKYAGYKDNADDTFQLDKWMEEETDAADKFFTCADTLLSATEIIKEITNSQLRQAIMPSWETEPLKPNFAKIDALSKKCFSAYYAAKKSTNADWMRVIWNIVENSEAGNDLPGALKLIDELAAHSDNILEFLARDGDDLVQSKFARTQLTEERRKAKLICPNADQTPNSWYPKFKEAEALPFLKGRLAVLLEASGEDLSAFEKCLGHCLANLGLCENKLDQNAMKQKMLAFFKSYLPYAQDCDLPLKYDRGFYNLDRWKSMFFRDTNKKGVIAWLKSFVDEQVPKNNTEWADNLLEHWDNLWPKNPEDYRGLVMYHYGWGNNKVFLYKTRNISGAQLISKSLRAELLEGVRDVALPWNYSSYNQEIKLQNGLKIVHRPDDTVAVFHDNVRLDKIGDFSLDGPLMPETLKDFITNCKDYPANCSPVK